MEHKVSLSVNGDILHAELVGDKEPSQHLYAFYFMKNSVADKKIWYSSAASADYSLPEDGVYSVTAFIKSDDGVTSYTSETIRYFRGWRQPPLPFYRIEEIEMTNICNLQCKNCCTPTTKYPRGLIEDTTVLSALSWMRKGQTVNYHRQGEPLLHKKLATYIRWGVETGVKPVISTNGILLTKEKLHELVQAGLRHLVITLHKPESVQAFVMALDYFRKNNISVRNFSDRFHSEPGNEADTMYFSGKILDFNSEMNHKLLKEFQADQKPYQDFLQFSEGHTWAGNVEGTRQDFGIDSVKQHQKQCYFLQKGVVNVRWDGTVVGCCFDSENENEIGHIKDFARLSLDIEKYRLCSHCDANWATK